MLQRHLIERQKELGWRDGKMADALGMPRTSYSAIKTGQYKISLPVARKIIRLFPDLAPYALVEDPPEPG